ncbi:MAG: exosortase-associated EpsI family protein [Verrucomicrobium sp.]
MLFRASLIGILFVATLLVCQSSPEIKGGRDSGVVMSLPEELPKFLAKLEEPDPVEKGLLPEDTEFAKAMYYTPTLDLSRRDVAHCSIVLSGAERKSIHRPEVCLQGQGWNLMDSRIIPIDFGNGTHLKVKDLYIEKPITLNDGTKKRLRAHYIYWFVGTDVSTPSSAERIWLTLWDNVTRNVNHRWAYPSLMAIVSGDFTPDQVGQRSRTNEETVTMLVDLIRQLAPKFQKDLMPNAEAHHHTASR